MTQAKIYRRRMSSRHGGHWKTVLKGVGAAVAATGLMVLAFSLLMQWLRPTDEAIRIVDQIIKLLSILAGCLLAIGRGGENGLIRGAMIGVIYMGAGVAVYALLTSQQAPVSAYLADLGMGVAGGGIAGMILSNLEPKVKS